MTKEDKYFDDLLREKLDGFAEAPPAHVWDGIQQAQKAARKKRLFFYLKLTGAAAAIVIAFLLGRQIALQPDEVLTPSEVVEAPADQGKNTNDETGTAIIDPVSKSPAEDLVTSAEQAEANEKFMVSSSQEIETTDNEENLAKTFQTKTVSKTIDTKQEDVPAKENFPILKSLTGNLFSFTFKPEEKQLATISGNNEPQSLTVDDLERIERNQQLLVKNEREDRKKPWRIAAMVSPNLAVNQTSYKDVYASNMSNPGSKESLSVGGGLAVTYKAGKRLSLQSGVYFSQLGQSSSNQQQERVHYNFISSDNTANYFYSTPLEVKSGQTLLNASAGVVEIENLPSNARIGNNFEAADASEAVFLTAAEFQQNFEYIEIPLNLRYQLIDSKVDVNLLGGFSSNWLISNNAYLDSGFGRERIGETRDMNKVSYSTTLGIGLGYGISNKISMHFEPQIKYFLGSLNKSSQISFRPYTIGIYTGVSYRF